MRLIDADALMYFGNHIGDEYEDKFHEYQWIYRDAIDNAPTIDAVEVVRCGKCKWYDPPHILYNDGTRKNVEKGELTVTADVGTNCGGKCMAHIKTYCTNHDREDPEDEPNIVIFRSPMDYCSYGERRTE